MTRSTKIIVSLLVTVATLAFVFSSISISDSLELLSKVDKKFVLLFFISSLIMSICSSWRYKLLLSAAGYGAPALSMYLIVLVRNLGSDLLPARIGTLVYIWLVKSRLAIPMHAALSSFSVALVLDIIAMCPLFILAAAFAANVAALSPINIILAAAILLVLILLVIFCGLRFFDYIYERFCRKLNQNWQQTICKARADLENINHRPLMLKLVVLSLCVRIFKYLGLYFFLLALLLPIGFSISELPFAKMFLGMSLAELSSSLPISGIAGLGAYQGVWIAAFTFLGFPLDLAKTTSISHHLFTQLYGYGLGLFALLILSLPFFVRSEALKLKKSKFFYLKFLLILITYALIFYVVVR